MQSVENCIEEALKIFEKDGHSKDSIKAIGITNQRETTVCWDIKSGEPLYNAIVWTDTRTAALARELKARPDSDKLQDVCGLPISTYPSVTKLIWLLRNVEKVRESYEAGNLAFGTMDAWLIYKLNGGPNKNVFVSDPTNASRTMFMDIHTLKYSDQMLDFFSYEFDLRKVHMPEIVRSADPKSFGQIANGSLKDFRITGCLGDQSAALVGQKSFQPGEAKNTYGTGCFLLYNVGEKPVISKHGLLATVAYDFNGTPVYALEGSIAVAGSGVKFLMHNLGFSHASHKITELAETVPDNGGLVFVTAFSGLFAPYWVDDAHGTMCKYSVLSCLVLLDNLSTYPSPLLTFPPSRHNSTHRTRPHRPRHPRGRLLPNKSHPRRHGARQRPQARRAQSRRRHVQLGPLHANASRPRLDPHRPPQNARNNRLGSRHRRRLRSRGLEDFRRVEGG